MVCKVKCECNERFATIIDTWKLFVEVKSYFEDGLTDGIFKDVTVIPPLDFGNNEEGEQIWYYAQRLLKCKVCNCLWALRYPDFPAPGRVWKYPDGIYHEEE